jgi:hypothetical protein
MPAGPFYVRSGRQPQTLPLIFAGKSGKWPGSASRPHTYAKVTLRESLHGFRLH